MPIIINGVDITQDENNITCDYCGKNLYEETMFGGVLAKSTISPNGNYHNECKENSIKHQ